MSELVDVLEECIEIVAAEEYLIDKVIMSEERANVCVNELQEFLNTFLLKIEREFPDVDKFKYRRIILPTSITPKDEGMILCDGEIWEVMKSSVYKYGGYEVFLKREK